MSLDSIRLPSIERGTFNCPRDSFPERFTQDSSTGFADGHQRFGRPRTRTALSQLAHQQTMHQQHEVEMPRLALTAAQLTIAQAQMLLTVPMQGFSPCESVARNRATLGSLPNGFDW